MKLLDVLLRRRPEPERERNAALIKHLQTESDRAIEHASEVTGIDPDDLVNSRLRRATDMYDGRLRGNR